MRKDTTETVGPAQVDGTTVAQAIVLIRSRLNLGRRHLAVRLDCPYGTVLKWENGRACPSPGYLVKLITLAKSTEERQPLVNALANRGIVIGELASMI